MLPRRSTISGKQGSEQAPAVFPGVVHNDLDAEHAFAFGIDLQRHLAAVHFEDRHIIRRCLDHDSPSRGCLFPLVIVRALLVAEDRLDAIQIERPARAVNQCPEDLLHLPVGGEQQIGAVLHLIDRVLVPKAAPFLFLQIETETETDGINPTLAELSQAPCSRLRRQGICDFCQIRGVGDGRKAVLLFAEADAGSPRLTGHVLVTVQNHLCAERRVTAHLDRQMAPGPERRRMALLITTRDAPANPAGASRAAAPPTRGLRPLVYPLLRWWSSAALVGFAPHYTLSITGAVLNSSLPTRSGQGISMACPDFVPLAGLGVTTIGRF